MPPSISVMCPTIGRKSLKALVENVLPQLQDGDEFLVIGDGPQPRSRTILGEFDDLRLRYAEYGPTRNWGGGQLDWGAQHLARGDFLMFVGDDDLLTESAVAAVRDGVRDKPWPHLFAMRHSERLLAHAINSGLCSGQQIVVPRMEKMAKWSDSSTMDCDYHYIQATSDLWEGKVEMHGEIICILTGQNHGRVE